MIFTYKLGHFHVQDLGKRFIFDKDGPERALIWIRVD